MDDVEPRRRLPVRAGLARLVDVRARPLPARRTWALSLVLTVAGLVLLPSALRGGVLQGGAGLAMTWWELAGVFALAGVFVFHVEINSEAYTFSLSELPLVLGLFFSQPRDLLLARLAGEAVVLLVIERQTVTKLVFNLSVFLVESSTCLVLFRLMGGRSLDPLAPLAWVIALFAVGAAASLGAGAVWTVIRLHGGRASPRQLLLAAAATVTANTSLAAIAAVLFSADRAALMPLLVVAGVLVTAYRGYTRLTKRYDGLTLLYQFTKITSGPQRPDETLGRVLDEARELLRADRAVIALFEPGGALPWLHIDTRARDLDEPGSGEAAALPAAIQDLVLRRAQLLHVPRTSTIASHRELLAELGAQDLIAVPLVSGGVVSGALMVCDRLGEVSTFDAEDARLFATLASQAAIALENGRLIERLHEQVRAREHEALHDALTGLPNRTLFSERLSDALGVGGLRRVAVLLLDLDGFKEVNDTLGHHTGDQLLREVAARLRDTVGDQGSVARLGGDEFAVLLPEVADPGAAVRVARSVTAALGLPVPLAAMTVEVGASVGVAVAPEHGTEPSTVLQRADVAMYVAKRARTGVSLYDPGADWNSELRLRLAGELRVAIACRQIDVFYQPVARTSDGQVVGVEALARWHHPELGRIGPDTFVPIAERTGLIHELTAHVLDRSLEQLEAWHALGLDLTMAVNLSPHVLRDIDWPRKVAQALRAHEIPPGCLTLEVTESALMTDPTRMVRLLDELSASGVGLAIDDFGTGYSSLTHLHQMPVSIIKIDKSFVLPMAMDQAVASIVQTVADLALRLGMTAVAEGVEDQQTLDLLAGLGCPLVQGYHLSRPRPAAELTDWLVRRAGQLAPVRALRVVAGGR